MKNLWNRDQRGKTITVVAVTSADQIGKVFNVVGQDVRRCLVCEELFTRLGAAEHASMVCKPELLRQPCLPRQLSDLWVGTQGVE